MNWRCTSAAQLSLGMIILLGLTTWTSNSVYALDAQTRETQIAQLPPAPPSTPPPNRTRSGGSLSEEVSCSNSPESLRALVPVENPVLTTSANPTFLFYVPYGAKDVETGEFSILVGRDETARLYRSKFRLPDAPGIVSIKLPDSYKLAESTPHHWYFKLYCAGNTSTRADLQVDGWVERVAATPERNQQIQSGSPEVWYDAIATVADRLAAAPQDRTARSQWQELLAAIGLSELGEVPLAGEAIPTE